jgi:hypothetical protein
MLLKNINSNLLMIKFPFFMCLAGIIVFLSGCSGTGDIPTASMAESGEVEVSWEEVAGARSYNIYMSNAPGVNRLSGYRIARVASPITITGLETGTTYYFILTVIDESGESQVSEEIEYTAVQDDTGSIRFVPQVKEAIPERPNREEEKQSAPKDTREKSQKSEGTRKPDPFHTETVNRNPPSVISTSDIQSQTPAAASSKMTVAWDSVPNAVSYNLYWLTTPGVTQQNGNQIKGVKSPYTFTGLNRGVTYYFVVTAVSQAGESQESVELSFSTPK